ncbi:MAG TPA: sulfite exporter TauE/SafE family protein [Acetobacteraceae bacterium]|nr:sulfite exporter TauE/SafE family protein [Acetobacteraceae bacterium]
MSLLASLKPLYTLTGFFVGLLVGQTGMGGGSLVTPILVLVFGVTPATAIGTDLLYASITKAVGTAVHGAHHTVQWPIVGRLAAGSVPATLVTLAAISHFDLSSRAASGVITTILGVMLLVTAVALQFRRRLLSLAGDWLELMPQHRTRTMTVIIGVVLGVLVTMSSVGAGAIGVTVLLLLYPRLPMARIVGSDIAHAVPLTLVAGLGHWMLGSVNVPMLVSLLIGSIPGIVLGSLFAVRVPDAVLRPVMAVTLAVVGGTLVF